MVVHTKMVVHLQSDQKLLNLVVKKQTISLKNYTIECRHGRIDRSGNYYPLYMGDHVPLKDAKISSRTNFCR